MSEKWSVSEDYKDDIVNERGTIIAQACDESKANLIAAAPEMYEALEAAWSGVPDTLREQLSLYAESSTVLTSIAIFIGSLKKIESALKKARGEQ